LDNVLIINFIVSFEIFQQKNQLPTPEGWVGVYDGCFISFFCIGHLFTV